MKKIKDKLVPVMGADCCEGRTYSGLSQDERKRIRRRQFLEAGIELFGTVGYRDTTVRALCKQAKLTDRYFYQSFGSMAKLGDAVYQHCMAEMNKEIYQVMGDTFDGDNFVEALEAGLDCYFRTLEDQKMARICMTEFEGVSPELNQIFHQYTINIGKVLMAMAEKAFPNWQLDAQEKEVIGISMTGIMRQTATVWLANDYGSKMSREKLVSGTLKIFLGTIEHINKG